jgi:hypothetical protein
MRLLAVASREPAACQALAWRISSHRGDERRGRDAKPSGLSSILMDVALHALLQWSGGNAEGHSSSSREAAEAQPRRDPGGSGLSRSRLACRYAADAAYDWPWWFPAQREPGINMTIRDTFSKRAVCLRWVSAFVACIAVIGSDVISALERGRSTWSAVMKEQSTFEEGPRA